MKPRQTTAAIVGLIWLVAAGAGSALLWDYAASPGAPARASTRWPAESVIRRAPGRPTLVMTAHPHCPCTRASIGELAILMTHFQGRLRAHVLFLRPAGFSEEWVKTDLWRSASATPGVNVYRDDGGLEARRFGAATSSQAFLYDAEGRLLFSGGITGARGHSGDNAGRSAIASLLTKPTPEPTQIFVFGCALFGAHTECEEGAPGCRNAK